MSDEFDKEAEREKLREKYGDDAEERKATERMSDLLLKGATMTNTHCGTCGDPLFRQNGVTFCPSCHGGPEGVEGTGVEGADSQAGERSRAQSPEQGQSQDRAQPSEPGAEATEIDVSSPGEVDGNEPEDGADPAGGPAGQSGPVPSESDERPTHPRRTRADARTPDRDRQPARANARAPSPSGSAPDRVDAPDTGSTGRAPAGSETDARESLVAALERFSAEAAATDDPRYARECLEAAREAAETLAALR